MLIQNPRNLPEAVYRAVCGDPDKVFNIDKTRIGVNDLIAPPMVRHLRFKHWEEMTDVVENRTWMMLGSAFHLLMEKFAPPNAVVEQKIEIEIDGHTISGIPDCYYGDTLDDYKTTSVWSYIYGDKPDWESQLNIYAYLIWKKHGLVINKLQILAVFKDFKEREAEKSSDYPPVPLMLMPIPVWTLEYTEQFIKDRIKAHVDIAPCNDKERYKTNDTYAVMKKGRKSALRVLDSMGEAELWKGANGGDSIDHRIGEYKRCKSYCSVSKFCPDNPYKEK